ncbi:hypothetical protein BVRB_7g169270 [Beta vulgaris subsp. vulgaris]|nr:hypothetical protein BVRB_7g169270 [Beta vulgaris subsp. vulgaris]
MASSNIDLFVDEAYLSALIDDEPLPISDEKYSHELHLQEALISSSSIPQKPLFQSPKTEDKNQSNNVKREIGESSQTQLIFCGICMDYKQNPEIFKGLINCKHSFCTDCIIKYVVSKIKENIGLVECPDPKCKLAIEPENCSGILPKEVFERWENALFEAMIPGYQKFYCPYKDCSVLMVDDGGVEVRSSECQSCRRLFCARCQVQWHDGVTCEEFQMLGKDEREKEDIMVMKLAKDEKWRRCPNCRIHVEKTEGCHHMSCRSVLFNLF